jgi:hypothetical protein
MAIKRKKQPEPPETIETQEPQTEEIQKTEQPEPQPEPTPAPTTTPEPPPIDIADVEALNKKLIVTQKLLGTVEAAKTLKNTDRRLLTKLATMQAEHTLMGHLANKLGDAELAFLVTVNALAFNSGYSTAMGHVAQGRNFHAEIESK